MRLAFARFGDLCFPVSSLETSRGTSRPADAGAAALDEPGLRVAPRFFRWRSPATEGRDFRRAISGPAASPLGGAGSDAVSFIRSTGLWRPGRIPSPVTSLVFDAAAQSTCSSLRKWRASVVQYFLSQ